MIDMKKIIMVPNVSQLLLKQNLTCANLTFT